MLFCFVTPSGRELSVSEDKSWSSCFHLPSAGITDTHDHSNSRWPWNQTLRALYVLGCPISPTQLGSFFQGGMRLFSDSLRHTKKVSRDHMETGKAMCFAPNVGWNHFPSPSYPPYPSLTLTFCLSLEVSSSLIDIMRAHARAHTLNLSIYCLLISPTPRCCGLPTSIPSGTRAHGTKYPLGPFLWSQV